MTKTFFIDLHGCAKNQVDAEIINGILIERGWKRTDEPADAKLIIVNSCGFIEPAKEESLNAVLSMKENYPEVKILLAGCLAERYSGILKDSLPEADGIFGNGDLTKIGLIADSLFERKIPRDGRVIIAPQEGICCGIRPEVFNFPRSVYIKITEGCSNMCSFCAIPLIRGKLRSRPPAEIIEEIEKFIKQGFYEFNLIGQDLAAFDCHEKAEGESGLAFLLKEISRLKGNFVVRLLYIHPDHFPQDILPVMTSSARFLPYFDIPFQSGSEKIIKAMNRQGSAEKYLKLAGDIRKAFSQAKSPYKTVALRTTFMAGFPGETDDDFLQTKNFLEDLKSLWSGVFIYSKEEDTKAAAMRYQVAKKIKKQRFEILRHSQKTITENLLQSFCGEKVLVLIEEVIPKMPEEECMLAVGRAWFQAPEVDGTTVVNFTDSNTGIDGGVIKAGSVVLARISAVNGIDVEAVAEQVKKKL